MTIIYMVLFLIFSVLGGIVAISAYELSLFLLLRALGKDIVAVRFGCVSKVGKDEPKVWQFDWLSTPIYVAPPLFPVSTIFIEKTGTNGEPRLRGDIILEMVRSLLRIDPYREWDYERAAQLHSRKSANVSFVDSLLCTMAPALVLVFPLVFLATLPIGLARNYAPATVPTVGKVLSPAAEEAGLVEGDRIIAVNNIQVTSWNQFAEEVMRHQPVSEPATFTVQRGDDVLSISYIVTPAEDDRSRMAGFSAAMEPRRMGIRGAVNLGMEMMREAPGTIMGYYLYILAVPKHLFNGR